MSVRWVEGRWLLTISALFAYKNNMIWKGMLEKEKNSQAKRRVEVLQGAQTRKTKIKLLFYRDAFSVPLLTALFISGKNFSKRPTNQYCQLSEIYCFAQAESNFKV